MWWPWITRKEFAELAARTSKDLERSYRGRISELEAALGRMRREWDGDRKRLWYYEESFCLPPWETPRRFVALGDGVDAVMPSPVKMGEVIRKLQEKEEKEEKLTERIAELTQALGLLSTLHPKMEIDIENPVSMAEQIYAHVMNDYYGKDG